MTVQEARDKRARMDELSGLIIRSTQAGEPFDVREAYWMEREALRAEFAAAAEGAAAA